MFITNILFKYWKRKFGFHAFHYKVIKKTKYQTLLKYFHQFLFGTTNYKKKDNSINQNLKFININHIFHNLCTAYYFTGVIFTILIRKEVNELTALLLSKCLLFSVPSRRRISH